MKWIDVNEKLPEYRQEVLALIESKPFDFFDGANNDHELFPKYHYQIAQLQEQFKTNRPFWVIDWDHEPIETVDLVVTHWMPLPKPPLGDDYDEQN